MIRCLVLESDGIANSTTELVFFRKGYSLLLPCRSYLFTDALGNAHGSDAPRLGAPNKTELSVALLHQVLGKLRRLTSSRLGHDNNDCVFSNDVHELFSYRMHREIFALLTDGLLLCKIRHCLNFIPPITYLFHVGCISRRFFIVQLSRSIRFIYLLYFF